MRETRLGLALVLAFSLAAACGDDGEDGGGADGGGGSSAGGSGGSSAGGSGGSSAGGSGGSSAGGSAGSSAGGSGGRAGGAGGSSAGGAGGSSAGGAGGSSAGGAGGRAGAGGAGGAMGMGGAGGAGACNFPKCLTDLMVDCAPMGACMYQQSATGSNTCWANGVKHLSSFMMSGTSATSVLRVTKTNGTTCYTVETPFMVGQTTFMGTYKNPGGNAVATFTIDQMGAYTVTCTGGQPVRIDTQACADQAPRMNMGGSSGSSCTMGMCM